MGVESKIQDMIDSKEIEFDPPETPNVITAPMPNHDKWVNAIDDVSAVEGADSDSDMDNWIFPTTANGINNWKAEDFIPISFSQD